MRWLHRIKRAIAGRLEYQSMVKHRSQLGRHLAPPYTAYLQQCRSAFGGDLAITADLQQCAEEFDRKGFASFWTAENKKLADAILAKIQEEEQKGLGIWNEHHCYREDIYLRFPEIDQLFQGALGSFLMATYKTYFKIFFGVLYKSERLLDSPQGSQLWHADGGPGTCINVMFYLSEPEKEHGAMECLPWDASLEIYRKRLQVSDVLEQSVRRPSDNGKVPSDLESRKGKCDFCLEEITRSYLGKVEQPVGKAGLLLAFRNNILHKGGYPEPGRERYVCVFHCYPSHKPTPYERYRKLGVKKTAPYPVDPTADF